MERRPSLNAKVGAVALLSGAVSIHFLNQFYEQLLPLRLVSVCVLVVGAWALSDEMGLRKPLNRAACVCFVLSMLAVGIAILDGADARPQYVVVYVFALLFSMLLWSTAFLHRAGPVKLAGLVGIAAGGLPLAALIAGHVFVGAGAFMGIGALLSFEGGTLAAIPVRTIEAAFVFWSVLAAAVSWSGRISEPAAA